MNPPLGLTWNNEESECPLHPWQREMQKNTNSLRQISHLFVSLSTLLLSVSPFFFVLSQPAEVTPCVQCDTELSPPTPCIALLPPAGLTPTRHPAGPLWSSSGSSEHPFIPLAHQSCLCVQRLCSLSHLLSHFLLVWIFSILPTDGSLVPNSFDFWPELTSWISLTSSSSSLK